ncbi:MAG: hypothetical protein EON59_02095 [Alphaproteobacteria bacterium]|nr:MAG: hypothetical protein EON59_02095 [Alphaproteobacteria bacterium]
MSENIAHPIIYRRDGVGRLRYWRVERSGSGYRTISGLMGGKPLVSGWMEARAQKAIGALDAIGGEIERLYRFHLTRDYHRSIEEIDKPRFFKPMLAGRYEKFEPGFAQPKLDGIRCIANAGGLFTRQGRPIVGTPHIANALQPIFESYPEAVLDGELYHHDLRYDFQEIIRLVRRQQLDNGHRARSAAMVQYYVYDLPSAPSDFAARHAQLRRMLEPTAILKLVETQKVDNEADYDAAHFAWLEAGYEGSMWRKDARYEQTRSSNLLKRKPVQDAEFECLRIECGRGAASGRATRAICRTKGGEVFAAGIKANHETAATLLHQVHPIVTVEYLGLTPRGVPRFPVAVKFWGEGRH